MEFQVQQQVVVRRSIRSHARTAEVRVGTILAFADDGETAVVSIPGPGGKVIRETVGLGQLEPVTNRFRRASVQFNPAFRQVAGYRLA